MLELERSGKLTRNFQVQKESPGTGSNDHRAFIALVFVSYLSRISLSDSAGKRGAMTHSLEKFRQLRVYVGVCLASVLRQPIALKRWETTKLIIRSRCFCRWSAFLHGRINQQGTSKRRIPVLRLMRCTCRPVSTGTRHHSQQVCGRPDRSCRPKRGVVPAHKEPFGKGSR